MRRRAFWRDYVFEPMVQNSTLYARYFADISGVGVGRGIAVLISCAGLGMAVFLAVTLWRGWCHRLNLTAPPAEK